jgi:putative hydrolase of the HAD superfamily
MTPRGYIFDYGGTLDTHGCHWGKVIWHAYRHCGVQVPETEFREAYVHAERILGRNPIIQPNFTFRQTLEAKLRLQLEFLHSRTSSSCILSHLSPLTSFLYNKTVEETSRSREVLIRLKEHHPMVLVSNFYGNIATVLKEFQLDGIFQTIIESAVVGIRKPDPRIFTLGVEALGLHPEEVVVVGDSIDKDIIPAKIAGCQTIWFRGEGWTDDPVDESVPDRIITSLNEI